MCKIFIVTVFLTTYKSLTKHILYSGCYILEHRRRPREGAKNGKKRHETVTELSKDLLENN